MSDSRTTHVDAVLGNWQAIRRQLICPSGGDDVTMAQWSVLSHLSRCGQASVKEIAGACGITSSAITQLVDALERKELVLRTTDDADRRTLSVRLTSKAEQRMAEVKVHVHSRMTEVLAPLTDEELAEYARLTTKIAGSAKA